MWSFVDAIRNNLDEVAGIGSAASPQAPQQQASARPGTHANDAPTHQPHHATASNSLFGKLASAIAGIDNSPTSAAVSPDPADWDGDGDGDGDGEGDDGDGEGDDLVAANLDAAVGALERPDVRDDEADHGPRKPTEQQRAVAVKDAAVVPTAAVAVAAAAAPLLVQDVPSATDASARPQPRKQKPPFPVPEAAPTPTSPAPPPPPPPPPQQQQQQHQHDDDLSASRLHAAGPGCFSTLPRD